MFTRFDVVFSFPECGELKIRINMTAWKWFEHQFLVEGVALTRRDGWKNANNKYEINGEWSLHVDNSLLESTIIWKLSQNFTKSKYQTSNMHSWTLNCPIKVENVDIEKSITMRIATFLENSNSKTQILCLYQCLQFWQLSARVSCVRLQVAKGWWPVLF